MSQPTAFFWFRRDLRLHDNTGLIKALESGFQVQPVFIFDDHILTQLPKDDTRVSFIHQELSLLNQELKKWGSSLRIEHGLPQEIWKRILEQENTAAIFCNEDYETYGIQRDQAISEHCSKLKIEFNSYKDHVIKKPGEVLKADGSPYLVYTPFKNKYLELLQKKDLGELHLTEAHQKKFKTSTFQIPSLESLGFERSNIDIPSKTISQETLADYASNRDFPGLKEGTTRLGVHLRFGTISIRKLFATALESSITFTSELIWREFFMHIFYFFPHTVSKSFKPKYDNIVWRNNEAEFEKWKNGKTGVPIVDAGMRELNQTGFMHNRVRMITASYLCKNLLIDWRWGEAYFAEKLLDFELSSNIGNWQWAAGCGCDAAPYFRIFNPETQAKKFDPNLSYIKRWVPEFENIDYRPMVDHKFARERCLTTYKKAL